MIKGAALRGVYVRAFRMMATFWIPAENLTRPPDMRAMVDSFRTGSDFDIDARQPELMPAMITMVSIRCQIPNPMRSSTCAFISVTFGRRRP